MASVGHMTPRISECFDMIIFVSLPLLTGIINEKYSTLCRLARVKHLDEIYFKATQTGAIFLHAKMVGSI